MNVTDEMIAKMNLTRLKSISKYLKNVVSDRLLTVDPAQEDYTEEDSACQEKEIETIKKLQSKVDKRIYQLEGKS